LKAVAAADLDRIEYRIALLGRERRDAVNFFQMDIPITHRLVALRRANTLRTAYL
jgi:hypothetical protein